MTPPIPPTPPTHRIITEPVERLDKGDVVVDATGRIGIAQQMRYVWVDAPTTHDANARGRWKLLLDVLWANGTTETSVDGDDLRQAMLPGDAASRARQSFLELIERAERAMDRSLFEGKNR